MIRAGWLRHALPLSSGKWDGGKQEEKDLVFFAVWDEPTAEKYIFDVSSSFLFPTSSWSIIYLEEDRNTLLKRRNNNLYLYYYSFPSHCWEVALDPTSRCKETLLSPPASRSKTLFLHGTHLLHTIRNILHHILLCLITSNLTFLTSTFQRLNN